MSSIRFTGINHLAMVTRDMDMTIRFWRDLLGMRLVAGLGDSLYRHYFFEISPHDMIAFFEWPDVETPEIKDHGVPQKGPIMFDHVSFEVENDDALWALKNKLEATDTWVSDVIDHGFIHSIYTFDPNNIPIEFSAPAKEVDLRARPRMKDRRPTQCAQEGPDPQKGYPPIPLMSTPEEERDIFEGEGRILVEE
ncbi:MAG: VOC family protein [Desulfatiglans sp.]|jgi:catechol 2,3-dioxygenase-like lactoylglutathione lyase family enzyme|nr:VOC family protein [Thermodesulfobacteriota bacterium]MEE4354015.1 VOC family protein [Desulfatiglans sp.]